MGLTAAGPVTRLGRFPLGHRGASGLRPEGHTELRRHSLLLESGLAAEWSTVRARLSQALAVDWAEALVCEVGCDMWA